MDSTEHDRRLDAEEAEAELFDYRYESARRRALGRAGASDEELTAWARFELEYERTKDDGDDAGCEMPGVTLRADARLRRFVEARDLFAALREVRRGLDRAATVHRPPACMLAARPRGQHRRAPRSHRRSACRRASTARDDGGSEPGEPGDGGREGRSS